MSLNLEWLRRVRSSLRDKGKGQTWLQDEEDRGWGRGGDSEPDRHGYP